MQTISFAAEVDYFRELQICIISIKEDAFFLIKTKIQEAITRGHHLRLDFIKDDRLSYGSGVKAGVVQR